MTKNYEALLEYIRTLTIIDTHEHLDPFEEKRPSETDFLQEYLRHYFNSDLVSSGLPLKDLDVVLDHSKPLMDRWRLVEPFWENARNTGYGRALDHSVRILYGIPGINSKTAEALDAAFQASLKPGHYRHVLKDICRIQTSILDALDHETRECDRELFSPLFMSDDWIHPQSFDFMTAWAEKHGIRLHRLEDWEDACTHAFEEAVGQGIVAVKCALAYERPIAFPRPHYADADAAFCDAASAGLTVGRGVKRAPGEAFENHMMHFICRLAGKHGITFQIHTGIQEGYGNNLYASYPVHLNNLFHEYPEVKFDVFHISYPWYMELATLSKQFQNVFIDMCWSHIISPEASVKALSEFLDAVPVNKISAFGGDYVFIDGVPGHLHMAQIDVARALDMKIEQGFFDIDEAKAVSKKLFYENPASLFGIKPNRE